MGDWCPVVPQQIYRPILSVVIVETRTLAIRLEAIATRSKKLLVATTLLGAGNRYRIGWRPSLLGARSY